MQFEELLKMLDDGKISFIVKEIKAQKKSGVIYVPMKSIGKKVILIFLNGQ
jgi:hypothetical protein